jgi:probable phosphoglycerate mutase
MIKNLYKMFTLRFDGGSQPNPGPGAGAYWIESPDKVPIEEGGVYMERCTNNIAEYMGLLEGLKACLQRGIKALRIEGDSMLVVCQITCKWKATHSNIVPLWTEAMALLKQFEHVEVDHILRKHNSKADQLSDLTIKTKVTWKSSL